ncbi:MAG TPA: aldehyde dehydrogenase [Bacteroidia bacterium]|jgi:aminomuconate-semialdehyde/2-hydroxymuconate-6-semialdehyde dehydrogenase|nr:aldehyde dehydrogenase [Bacteroidia bacterium]
MEKIQNYINGELVAPAKSKYLDNYNPSTGKVYSQIPDSDEEDVQKAVEAAKKAFPVWSKMPKEERSKWIMRLANLLEKRLEEFVYAETIDNGKPLSLSRSMDIPRAVSNLEFFATGMLHFASEAHSMEGSAINYTLRDPIGIVGCISPWNLPLYLFTWKIAPALAMGNCVVAKPSEITPMTAYMLSKLCAEIGFPKGVFNIVHGLGGKTGNAIVSHPEIKAISFTGGTKTGAAIASVAAPMFKKLSLELGGKNPVVIFNDCNWDKMMKTTLSSSFTNQGEICLCGSRILVEKSAYDKFKKDFVEKTQVLKVGNPLEESSKLGAIVSKQHYEKILSYIDLAKQEGGKILCGGKAIKMQGEQSEGWYIEPTVIEGLPYNCRTNMEEIFGPVVTIMPFDTEEQAMQLANSTEYGLTSMLWTENLTRAHKLAEELRSGIVWINCWLLRDLRTPFGGVKNSGVGREGGWEAMRFFTEPKNVCIKL